MQPQVAASEPPESAFTPASKQAASDDGDRKMTGKDAAASKKPERSGSVWGVFGRVSSLLSTGSNGKKKVRGSAHHELQDRCRTSKLTLVFVLYPIHHWLNRTQHEMYLKACVHAHVLVLLHVRYANKSISARNR